MSEVVQTRKDKDRMFLLQVQMDIKWELPVGKA